MKRMDPSTYNGYYRARRKKVILNRVSSFDKAGDGDPTDVLVLMELAFSGTVPRKIAGQGEVPGSLYQSQCESSIDFCLQRG